MDRLDMFGVKLMADSQKESSQVQTPNSIEMLACRSRQMLPAELIYPADIHQSMS